jgi:hypothetical protein
MAHCDHARHRSCGRMQRRRGQLAFVLGVGLLCATTGAAFDLGSFKRKLDGDSEALADASKAASGAVSRAASDAAGAAAQTLLGGWRSAVSSLAGAPAHAGDTAPGATARDGENAAAGAAATHSGSSGDGRQESVSVQVDAATASSSGGSSGGSTLAGRLDAAAAALRAATAWTSQHADAAAEWTQAQAGTAAEWTQAQTAAAVAAAVGHFNAVRAQVQAFVDEHSLIAQQPSNATVAALTAAGYAPSPTNAGMWWRGSLGVAVPVRIPRPPAPAERRSEPSPRVTAVEGIVAAAVAEDAHGVLAVHVWVAVLDMAVNFTLTQPATFPAVAVPGLAFDLAGLASAGVMVAGSVVRLPQQPDSFGLTLDVYLGAFVRGIPLGRDKMRIWLGRWGRTSWAAQPQAGTTSHQTSRRRQPPRGSASQPRAMLLRPWQPPRGFCSAAPPRARAVTPPCTRCCVLPASRSASSSSGCATGVRWRGRCDCRTPAAAQTKTTTWTPS